MAASLLNSRIQRIRCTVFNMAQNIITAKDGYKELDYWLNRNSVKNLLLVCDRSIEFHKELNNHLAKVRDSGINIVRFSGFVPNPQYESVVAGVDAFLNSGCDSIFAVGGGSAIDVAKCIKLYSNMDRSRSYLTQEIVPNDIPFIVMPTTAGSGSEATRYAVIYLGDEKQSITSESIIPGTVILDHNCLKTLPPYQKKSTMMDALSHAVESFWSVNSNEESKEYARLAISGVLSNMDGYLANTDEGNHGMLLAAHKASQAINITQTTAGHAMCYKITSHIGLAHGHAAILCNRVLYPWMVQNTDKCIDVRGEAYLKDTLNELASMFGYKDVLEGSYYLENIVSKLDLEIPQVSDKEIDVLKNSVNPVRLKNHPVKLDVDTIEILYRRILTTN